jgi:hypothetical protein
MMSKHIQSPVKKAVVDKTAARYVQTQMTTLLEEGHSLKRYNIFSNIGYAIIKPAGDGLEDTERIVNSIMSTGGAAQDGNKGKTDFGLEMNVKDKSCIRNAEEFEGLLCRITKRIMLDIGKNIERFYGGHVSFERAYAKESGRIFVLAYIIKAKMKHNADNRPIKVIVSDSEFCDADALHLFKQLTYSKRSRVFLSLKGATENPA